MPLDDVERATWLSQIERMQQLVQDLERASNGADHQRLRDRLRRERATAKDTLRVTSNDPTRG
jgi:hypothetical protein